MRECGVCEVRGARRSGQTSDFIAWHFEVERKSALLLSPQWPVGVPYDAKETCAGHWDIRTQQAPVTSAGCIACGIVAGGQRDEL